MKHEFHTIIITTYENGAKDVTGNLFTLCKILARKIKLWYTAVQN